MIKSRKSICVYSPWMMPLGGIETHLVNLSCYLAGQGWRVDFCVKYSAITSSTADKLSAAGVRYHRFPTPSFFRHTLISNSLLYTNSQGNTSPLIWKHGRSGRRGFHHCHTACSPAERSSWTLRYVRFIENGPPLVACSRTTAEGLLALNPGRRIHVLPYFAIGEDVAPLAALVPDPDRPALGSQPILRFGFIGRLEAGKGIDLIIQASRRPEFSDIQWHVFGDGAEGDRVRASTGVNLVFHGAFDRSVHLRDIFGPLDAVVLPSSHVEGSPLCLIEALAFGKPWIAFDQGGIRELVASHEDCLVLVPGRPEGFFDAVDRLRVRLRAGQVDEECLRGYYQQHFSPKAVYNKWSSLINSL